MSPDAPQWWVVGYHRLDRDQVKPGWEKVVLDYPGVVVRPDSPKLCVSTPRISLEFMAPERVVCGLRLLLGPPFVVQSALALRG